MLGQEWSGDGDTRCTQARDPSELIATLALATVFTVAACYFLLGATLTFRSRELPDLGKWIDKDRDPQAARTRELTAARRAAAQPDTDTRDEEPDTGASAAGARTP